jgi:hypothetical protein
MGSNKVGGASVSELMSQRYISSSVPPSVLQDAQNVHLGQKLGDSPNVLSISSYVKGT